MLAYRVIARLDIKGPNLIKGIQFEGLRVIGNPAQFAKKYADEGADELLYIDTVASLYGRSQIHELLDRTVGETFIPVTVGGGIRDHACIRGLFNAGADKLAFNTAVVERPERIVEFAERYGRQAIVVSIEAKRVNGGWNVYTDCGRIDSGKDAVRWADDVANLGAGELLITSIDCDGARRGHERELLKQIDVDIPVIYSGGIRLQDVAEVAEYSDGMAIGTSLHYGDCTIAQVKEELRKAGKEVR